MRAFPGNPLMNDDPMAMLSSSTTTSSVALQLFQVLSNLVGIAVVWAMYRVDNATMGAIAAIATLYSILYHLCKSANICLKMNLVITTMMDHATAPTLAGIVLLVAVMMTSAETVMRRHRVVLEKLERSDHRYGRTPTEPQIRGLSLSTRQQKPLSIMTHTDLFGDATKNGDDREVELVPLAPEAERRVGITPDNSYYYQYLYKEEYMIHDAWSVTVVLCLIFVAFNSVLVHPSSMQAFLIVIAFALSAVFFKVVVLDDGHTELTRDTLSLVDVVVGIVLIAVGLIFFVLDTWYYYDVLHPFWHLFSFTGMFFYGMGVSKLSPNFYSPSLRIYEKLSSRKGRSKSSSSQ
jgi:hypothetical protein